MAVYEFSVTVDEAYEQYVDPVYLAEDWGKWMFYEMDIPAVVEFDGSNLEER